VFPIPGTRRSDRLQENVEAFALSQKLTKQDLDELEACCPVNAAVGDRSVTFLSSSTQGRHARLSPCRFAPAVTPAEAQRFSINSYWFYNF
jgi:hypothetical protein